MSQWKMTTIGEICQNIITGGTPLSNNADFYKDGNIPWLKTKEVNFCRIRRTESHISQLGLANSSAKIIPINSVIIAMYGQGDTAGRVAINEIPVATNQACCNLVIDEKLADYNFIYFCLKNSYRELVNAKTGSAQPNLNTRIIKEFPIKLPSLQEQKEISAVLVCLDRKIENLRKQNETLEQIAQNLFKHWFVDFEFPNDDGKPYKSSGGEMVRSELGDIPVGWRVVKMEEIADRISMGPFGSRITTDNFVDRGVPVIRGGNLVNGFNEIGFVYLTEEKADDLKSSNAFPEDVIFTHRGTLGQVGFIPTHSQYPRYVVSQSQMLLGVNKKIASPRFIYRFFCSQVGLNAILANTNTTGVPSIGRPTTTLKSIQTALPKDKVMHQFDSLIISIDFKKDANNKQIQTLVQTRDALLSKLMSGQISVI
jgi:type I restriction enzyme, S subunit